MPELRGLPGVKGALAVQHVVSVEQALTRIQKRRAVTAAGDKGALNIWRDDHRVLRSNFCRFHTTLDSAVHADADDLRVWLAKWWPELGR